MNPKNEIARKNDLLRTSFSSAHGQIILTRSVSQTADLPLIIEAVRNFSDFEPENDPHQEHDFGAVEVRGQRYFWKIDYYDSTYRFFEEDGHRVLTILRADEY